MKNNLLMGVIGFILLTGGFYGGMQYQLKSETAVKTTQDQQGGGRFGARGNLGAGNRGGQTIGTVIAKDETSLTVKLADGGSKIVFISSETKASNVSDASMDTINVGTEISAFGTPNPDGSITAMRIQTGVINRDGFGRRGMPTDTPKQ